MCVIKLHAFIYFLRPPPWSGTVHPPFSPSGRLTRILHPSDNFIHERTDPVTFRNRQYTFISPQFFVQANVNKVSQLSQEHLVHFQFVYSGISSPINLVYQFFCPARFWNRQIATRTSVVLPKLCQRLSFWGCPVVCSVWAGQSTPRGPCSRAKLPLAAMHGFWRSLGFAERGVYALVWFVFLPASCIFRSVHHTKPPVTNGALLVVEPRLL